MSGMGGQSVGALAPKLAVVLNLPREPPRLKEDRAAIKVFVSCTNKQRVEAGMNLQRRSTASVASAGKFLFATCSPSGME